MKLWDWIIVFVLMTGFLMAMFGLFAHPARPTAYTSEMTKGVIMGGYGNGQR